MKVYSGDIYIKLENVVAQQELEAHKWAMAHQLINPVLNYKSLS